MQNTPRIMVLMDAARACGRGLLMGIAKYANLHRPWLFNTTYAEQPVGIELIKAWRPDGILMLETDDTEDILELGIPVAICPHSQEAFPGAANIAAQDATVGAMGAEYFIEKGYQHFAFFSFGDLFWSQARSQAFHKRVDRSGYRCEVHERPWILDASHWDQEQESTIAWVESLPKPVGVMTCTDDAGHFLIKACQTAGISVPEEVAVLGVDNDPLFCNLSHLPLSSVNLNFVQAGYDAALVMERMLTGEKGHLPEIHILATHVVTRQSTDTLAINDPSIAKALNYIRNHVTKPIQVSDVVAATNLSRCALYERFKTCMKRTVLDEIRRVRTEKISELLISTDMSITEIAYTMGFDGPSHIARYFKKIRGITPQQYRKLHSLGKHLS